MDDLIVWQIVVSGMGVLILILIAMIQRKTEKLKITQSLLAESKTEAYSDVFTIFFDILKDVKANKKTNETQSMKRLMDSKKTIFIYGSDKVFEAFSDWLQFSSSRVLDPNTTMEKLYNLLIEMRKDIGYKDTKISFEDFKVYLMQNRDEVLKFNTQTK